MSTELGKYEVLGKLALTETAELFVARTQGNGTPQKFVVLKRLKRDVAADTERAKAFIARSRLASRIEHLNVAQVIEVGKLGASFYCAMEFVDGESVRAIIQHARGKKIPIPVRVVLAIAAGAATGMRHAHEVKGEGGNVLGIVHGDIATHSVMVSRDGVVKLVGFGIAQDAKTSDRASDLEGLGAVLWELLTLQPIENGAAPPSSKRLDVPKELDAIVLKLLGKAGKYDYAGEVLAEIEGLAAKLDIAITTQDLARAMRLWFPDATAGNGDELKPVVVAAEQATGEIGVAAPGGAIDQMLDDVRANAGAIRSAVAAAVAQPTTRRRASTAVPANATAPAAERETFEQIRDRIMANARPKTPTGSAPNDARKKSDTLNPTMNQYSYITAVAGKETAPIRSVTNEKSEPVAAKGEIAAKPAAGAAAPVEADTEKMDAAAKAELEARARANAEEALRSEQKAKMLAEQRARAEQLKEQARWRAEQEEKNAEKLRNDAKARAVAEAAAALSSSMPAVRDPEPEAAAASVEAPKPAEVAEHASAAGANGKSTTETAEAAEAAEAAAQNAEADNKAEVDEKAEAEAEEKVAAKAAKAKLDASKAEAKADADAATKAAVESPDDDDKVPAPGKPKWFFPVIIGGAAVIGLVLFVASRGGGDKPKEAPPPPPPPVHTAVVVADAAQVAMTPDAPMPADAPEVVAAPPDATQVAVAPPADAAKVEAPPADAKTEVVADHHKPLQHGDDTADSHKPPKDDGDSHKPPKDDSHKPAADTRSIPELFGAGELAKVNKACATNTRFNSEILHDCGLAACSAKDVALAKRWSNALSGGDRADVIAKCTANGVDLSQ